MSKHFVDGKDLALFARLNKKYIEDTFQGDTLFVNAVWSYDSSKDNYTAKYFVHKSDLEQLLPDLIKRRKTRIRLYIEYLPPVSGGSVPPQTGKVGSYLDAFIITYVRTTKNGASSNNPVIIKTNVDIDQEGVSYQLELFFTYNGSTMTINENPENNNFYFTEIFSSGGGGGSSSTASSEEIQMLLFNYEEQSTDGNLYIENDGQHDIILTRHNDWYDSDSLPK